MDPEAIERVEQELDQFVERRAREARDAEKVAELWAESERRVQEKRREENREAWLRHERHMERLHLDLADSHRVRAERLLGEGAA